MRNTPMPRSLHSCLRALALLLGLAIVSSQAAAGSATVSTALDTDNNAATGCVVASANGPIAGIEQIASTVVTTTTTGATVARLERQLCTAGALGAPTSYDPGGWNVGLGNGTGGTRGRRKLDSACAAAARRDDPGGRDLRERYRRTGRHVVVRHCCCPQRVRPSSRFRSPRG